MALTLSRIDRIYRKITVTAVLPAGGPAVLTGVDVALLSVRATPTAATMWTATTYAAGVATILLAGPDASANGALVVPADCDLWMRVTDSPEVEAVFVERLTVNGSSASLAALPQTLTVLPTGGTNGQVLGIVNGAPAWVNVATYPTTSGLR